MSETYNYDMRFEAAKMDIADPETTDEEKKSARALLNDQGKPKIRTDYWRGWSRADGTSNTKNG